MAISIKGFCRLNISLAKNILFKPNFISVGVRNLYTEHDLGISTYESTRFVIRNQFLSIEDTFRAKMKDICNDASGIVYTEDLKAMLHLVRQEDTDLQLLNQMLDKYVQCKQERKFNLYVFGPVAMRAYYYLNQPQYALDAFNNPNLTTAFHYRSAFRIIMCLLYKHKLLSQLRDVYEKYLAAMGREFIGRHTVLLFAASLVENTPEAFEFAFQQWKDMLADYPPSTRGSTILALLAINVNQPNIGLEIISVLDRETISTIRSIKALAYMRLDKYMHILGMFRYALDQNNTTGRKQYFFSDVIYELEEKMNTSSAPERDEMLSLISQLKKSDLLESRSTLTEFLLRPIMINKGQQENDVEGGAARMRYRRGRSERNYKPPAQAAESFF